MVGEQIGEDFQTRDDIRRERGGKNRHRREHAVDPILEFQSVLARLQMQIARAGRARLGKHRLDDLRGILRIGRIETGERRGKRIGREIWHEDPFLFPGSAWEHNVPEALPPQIWISFFNALRRSLSNSAFPGRAWERGLLIYSQNQYGLYCPGTAIG